MSHFMKGNSIIRVSKTLRQHDNKLQCFHAKSSTSKYYIEGNISSGKSGTFTTILRPSTRFGVEGTPNLLTKTWQLKVTLFIRIYVLLVEHIYLIIYILGIHWSIRHTFDPPNGTQLH